ncbi:MAG: hypothetical protein ACLQVD_17890 [Capsulimonadaceae bacterium]
MSVSPARRNLYEFAFVRRCHQWLFAGYAALGGDQLCEKEEPAITGKLVASMEAVQESSQAPEWMPDMQVYDDPPENVAGREGKNRPRVDIRFRSIGHGNAYRLCVEAKRLCDGASMREYLGADGLGKFLVGDYGGKDRYGGMLGYVQTDNVDEWLTRLAAAFAKKKVSLLVTGDGDITRDVLVAELPHTQRSIHDRTSIGRPITIFHTFLMFAPTAVSIPQSHG